MDVAIIDNYDSFTYNIGHIVRNFPGIKLQIITAGEVDVDKLEKFRGIIFSPGPDIPLKGNIMEQVLQRYEGKISILGICLGLQAIVSYYGGTLVRLEEVVHGRTKKISLTSAESRLFRGTGNLFEAGLYHSWVASPDDLPECLEVTALSPEGRIMAIRHREYDIEAVQFHPESIMTPAGKMIIHNWLTSASAPL